MNRENVLAAIEVMKKAQNLDMEYFQRYIPRPDTTKLVDSIDELHACGNTACFVGYLAISGLPGLYRRPNGGLGLDLDGFHADDSTEALSIFLEISGDLAHAFIYGEDWDRGEDFYPVPFSKVKPRHVIEKLEQILAGELK